jgi:RHS repeat-associated protein
LNTVVTLPGRLPPPDMPTGEMEEVNHANNYTYNYQWQTHSDSTGTYPLKRRGLHNIQKGSNTHYRDYSYDANGNVTSDGSRDYDYTPFDKPWQITSGAQSSKFKYANRSRYLREDKIQEKMPNGSNYSGLTQYKTHYVGAYERIERTGGAGNKVEHKYQIAGAVLTRKEGETTFSTLFAHTDYQGSAITITDENGQMAEQFIYDPWGKKTKVIINNNVGSLVANLTRGSATTRGYTGHEGIDHFDLIHMNGRVYDAEVGRFLQADPNIQAPTNSQNYNRYSYVLNNPMSYTDPSGYFFKKIFKAISKVKWLSTVISAAMTIFIPGCQTGMCAAAFNSAMTYSLTGSLKNAAISFAAAAIMPGGDSWAAIAGSAMVGGMSSKLQGGNFGHGFFSAGIGAKMGGGTGKGWTKVLSAAVVGGTLSKITGGKFANGAFSAAFSAAMAENWGGSGNKQSSAGNTCSSANPINLATGEKYLVMRDYKGGGASKLAFERYYSSFAKERTGLGFGWRHNFDRQLTFNDKTVLGKARFITYQTQDNKQVSFAVRGDDLNQYQNNDDTADKLIKKEQGWQLTLASGIVELFNEQGQLVQVNDIGQYQQNLHYNDQGLLTSVTDSAGQQITLGYNRLGLLVSLETPDGVTNYEYNLASKVLTKAITPVDANGERGYKEYHYDDNRYRTAITSITNELDNTIHRMAYDNSGRAIMSALGDDAERVDVAFLDNRMSQVTSALGRRTTYQFDINNQPISMEGHATPSCIASNQAYEYDDRGNVVSKTDWNGATTKYTFNERNLETSRIEAAGTDVERTMTTEWHPEYAIVTSIITPANQQVFEYSESGLLLSHTKVDLTAEQNWLQSITDSYANRTITYQYNDIGQLIEVDGSRTDVDDITTYKYDETGNQIAVVNALGHSSKATEFDEAGRPTQLIAANGLMTELSYNQRGWLSSNTVITGEGDNQTSATTQYRYANSGNYLGSGQVERIISPNGAVTKYTYDKAYRVKSMTNHLGESIEYVRDLEGNPVQIDTLNTDGLLIKQQQQQFNELSQLIAQVGANYRIDHQYNGQGLLTKTINGLGNSTSQAFDALNRLVETTDAANGVVYQGYNSLNQVTHITDQRGLTTEYQYNGFGEKVKQISPDTGTTVYQYNNAGLLSGKVDNVGQVTEYDYDAIGRVTHAHYVDAANDDVFYQYDEQAELAELPLAAGAEAYAVGQTSQVIDSSGSSQYRYNAKGQVTAKVYQLHGESYSQQNLYNNRGQLKAQTYPSGMAVNYGYDSLGRVNSINSQTAGIDNRQAIIDNVAYLPFAGVERIDYANGVSQHNIQDIDGRLESIRLNKGFNSLHRREYNYDAANQIVDIVNVLDSRLSQHYDYDELSRLVNAQGEYGELNYHYDEVGNRLSRKWQLNNKQMKTDERYQYADNSNQLELVANSSQTSTREFNYNDNGNTEFDSKQGKTLTYNAANRLSHITFTDGSKAAYIYNAKGQRVIKTLADASGKVTTTHYHFNQQDLLIAETHDNGQPLVEYIYLNKQRVASLRYQEAEALIEFVHNDHLGSPMLQTNDEGELIWRNQALPFGQEYQASITEQGFGFPGQYQDVESGYSYNYFRDYDSSLGRYIQSDPIGLAGGVNTYGYVNGNPVGLFDFYGLDWSNTDALNHYKNNGPNVTLRHTGHLSTIQNSSAYRGLTNRFSSQVYASAKALAITNATSPGSYKLNVNFSNTYDFTLDKFFIGSATISGEFNGILNINSGGGFTYSGKTEFDFYDKFTDPYDIFDSVQGEWNPDGTPYEITDQWSKQSKGSGVCR